LKIRRLLFTIIFLMSLTSCSEVDEVAATAGRESNAEAPSNSTQGALIAIDSNNVDAAGYDEDSMTMTVQFKNGYVYEYYGIPAELWNSFIAAQPHPWSQVGYPRLVQAGVPYKRIR
jgi:hypothetical protein